MKPDWSQVMEAGAPTSEECAKHLLSKLRHYADATDLAADLAAQVPVLIVVDARSEEAYRREHIPGAVSLPYRAISATALQGWDKSKTYIVYSEGVGCIASTKGAYRMATLGFIVKELVGGLVFWLRDGYPVARGSEPGQLSRDGGAAV